DNLAGSVTFRTEQPIPKSQVLQVVRDILGRNGLEMRYMNGVYHVATAEVLTLLQQNGAAGRVGDQTMRVVRLHKENAREIIAAVRQLVPEEVTLAPSNGGSAVMIRAPVNDLDKVAELISSFDSNAEGEQLAIIPLREISPEKLASQL